MSDEQWIANLIFSTIEREGLTTEDCADLGHKILARFRPLVDEDQNIYDDAYYLQSAANPRAVIARFNEIMKEIVKELEAEYGHASTDDICFHPVFVLMSDKINAMGGYGYRYSEAYKLVVAKMTPEARRIHGIENGATA